MKQTNVTPNTPVACHKTNTITNQPLLSPPRSCRQEARTTPEFRPCCRCAQERTLKLSPSKSHQQQRRVPRQIHSGRRMASKLLQILHWGNARPPPRKCVPFPRYSPDRKAALREKPPAPGNLLVVVSFGFFKVVGRGNRSKKHRVEFNGLVIYHRRGGHTGRDFVRTQVVDPGHDLVLDRDVGRNPPGIHRQLFHCLFSLWLRTPPTPDAPLFHT